MGAGLRKGNGEVFLVERFLLPVNIPVFKQADEVNYCSWASQVCPRCIENSLAVVISLYICRVGWFPGNTCWTTPRLTSAKRCVVPMPAVDQEDCEEQAEERKEGNHGEPNGAARCGQHFALTSWSKRLHVMLRLVELIRGDQCEFGLVDADTGMPHQKPTGFLTASAGVKETLSRRCSGLHQHQPLEGGQRTKRAQEWTPQLCKAMRFRGTWDSCKHATWFFIWFDFIWLPYVLRHMLFWFYSTYTTQLVPPWDPYISLEHGWLENDISL